MTNIHIAKTRKKVKLPDSTKLAVAQQAKVFIETYFKPNFIQLPPENENFKYIVDFFQNGMDGIFIFAPNMLVPVLMQFHLFLKLDLPVLNIAQ